MLIDTHQVVEDIIKAGLNKKQAEVITKVINQNNNDLVTKSDLKLETNAIRSEIGTIKWMLGLLGALNLMILSIILSGKF